nr:hypothetical protein [Tanacetum cinerariifolium]
MREHLQIIFISSLSILLPLKLQAGHDEVVLGMKMVGSGMLMIVVVVAVVEEIEVVSSLYGSLSWMLTKKKRKNEVEETDNVRNYRKKKYDPVDRELILKAILKELEYRTSLVCVANSSTYITMPANEGHSEFDTCCRQTRSIRTAGESSSINFWAKNRCQEVISSLQKHADFGIVTFDPKALGYKVLSSYLLRSSDRLNVALKSKHEENEAYLSERPLAKHTMKSKLLKWLFLEKLICIISLRIVGKLLQLGGYLKLIEFGLDDCVDGIEA